MHRAAFLDGGGDEHGRLIHIRGGRWAFSYRPGEDDDEPVSRFDHHVFKQGEYVSVSEHDGVARPFRIVRIDASPALRA